MCENCRKSVYQLEVYDSKKKVMHKYGTKTQLSQYPDVFISFKVKVVPAKG